MKKRILMYVCTFLLSIVFFASALPAQEGRYTGKQIENRLSAVRAANPGDYILLKSGKKYVLTKEEIDIANKRFDYKDLSQVETKTQSDGTEVKTISEAHVAYVYKDGQAIHVLKTGASFSAFMKHIEDTYYITRYVDLLEEYHDVRKISSPRFDVFRASVQFQKMSNGTNEIEGIMITAYNHKGQNYMMRYCSDPDMIWGYISNRDSYKPTGESRQLDFDRE
ncbi:MAG: hypothetical protein LBC99_04205 [Spirochaetota bacterium]|jgi:hypothetical protein|nr:hypothetical protein [Spirochaetota bacterium]